MSVCSKQICITPDHMLFYIHSRLEYYWLICSFIYFTAFNIIWLIEMLIDLFPEN